MFNEEIFNNGSKIIEAAAAHENIYIPLQEELNRQGFRDKNGNETEIDGAAYVNHNNENVEQYQYENDGVEYNVEVNKDTLIGLERYKKDGIKLNESQIKLRNKIYSAPNLDSRYHLSVRSLRSQTKCISDAFSNFIHLPSQQAHIHTHAFHLAIKLRRVCFHNFSFHSCVCVLN